MLERYYKFLIIAILLLTSLVFINTLKNNFVWDDYAFIVNFPTIKSFDNFPEFIQGAAPEGHERVYRPLRTILYAISYIFLWSNNPAGYHLQALIFHLIITFMVFMLSFQLSKNKTISLTAMLLFGLHPIHTEAVSFITASFDLPAAGLAIASFYFYLLWEDKKKYSEYFLYTSLILCLLGFFWGEIAISLPILILTYRVVVIKKKPNLKHLAYFSLIAIYLITRIFVTGTLIRGPITSTIEPIQNLVMMSKIIVNHPLSMIIPINLSVNHELFPGINSEDFISERANSLPLVDLKLTLLILTAIISIAFVILTIRRSPLIAFSVIWFWIALIPVTNIIPSGVLFAERHSYLASFGFCLMVGILLFKVIKYSLPSFWILLIFISLSYGFLTIKRNFEWKDSFTLWSKTLEQTPDSSSSRVNLGMAYDISGNNEKAKDLYLEAIRINPGNNLAKNNLATLFLEVKDYERAALVLEDVISQIEKLPGNARPTDKLLVNLVDAYLGSGQIEKAKELLQKMVKQSPNNPKLYLLLGNIYIHEGSFDKAMENLKKSIKLNPSYFEAYNNLGILYAKGKEYEKARDILIIATKINPSHPDAYYNLGSVYLALKDYEKAKFNFEIVLEIKPDFKAAEEKLKIIENNSKRNGS